MRVGFLNNQIDNRGTGNALFDYAHYNEKILGNESMIFTRKDAFVDPLMERRILDRFGGYSYIESLFGEGYKRANLDVLYHIKYGNDTQNSISLPGTRYVVHAVFDASNPHGDRFATISNWLRERYNHPWENSLKGIKPPPATYVVPHIIDLPHSPSARAEYGIPEDATVFGRHGGPDTFDIPWVWEAIEAALDDSKNTYFLFLNTDVPYYYTDKRIIQLPPTNNPKEKAKFINSCDAMLHARQRGETFGIAVGEFDAAFKPVITYGLSPEKAHIQQLHNPILYFSAEGLADILLNWDIVKTAHESGEFDESYLYFTPKYVMNIFKEVFLDD